MSSDQRRHTTGSTSNPTGGGGGVGGSAKSPPLATASPTPSPSSTPPAVNRRSSAPLPGLNTTASSIRARVGGSGLRRVVSYHDEEDDEDDDDDDEGGPDADAALHDLRAGIIMPGMGGARVAASTQAALGAKAVSGGAIGGTGASAASPNVASSGQGVASAALANARARLPATLKAASIPSGPARRSTAPNSSSLLPTTANTPSLRAGGASPASSAPQRNSATAGAPPSTQNRYKGTPARATRYSLPVRAEKPVRTSKTSGKHVLLPSESQLAPLPGDDDDDDDDDDEEDDEDESGESTDEAAVTAGTGVVTPTTSTLKGAVPDKPLVKPPIAIDATAKTPLAVRLASPTRAIPPGQHPPAPLPARGPVHARAPPRVPKSSGPAYHTFERLAPSARVHTPLPRITSYAIGPSIHLPTLIGFLRREHGVRPRLYDECAYVVYFKPLLPGFGRAEVRSAPEPRSGSPGGESRRERELEEREESGYVGSYFAATKEEEEDPEGYIKGGEGKGDGEEEDRRTDERERVGASAVDVAEAREEQRVRSRAGSRDTSPRRPAELSESEAEGAVLASSPETGGASSYEEARNRFQDQQQHQQQDAEEEEGGMLTPRALEPRKNLDEALALLSDDEGARLLESEAEREALEEESESEYRLRSLDVDVDADAASELSEKLDVLATRGDDELLSADEAGARDMYLQSHSGEDTTRGVERGAVELAQFIDQDMASTSGSRSRSKSHRNGASRDEDGAELGGGGGGGRRRRARKARKQTGPNLASHNHDTSANMLTSRNILEALQQAELIILPYGVLVMYNLSAADERSLINDVISSGCVRGGPALAADDEETEAFHYCYDPTVPAPRIFNDFFTFRAPNHLLKLSLAHAIAQSTKLSVFEESMQRTLELTSHIPKELASSGELKLKRREALRLTGRLFKLRVDVNLTSNVLDTPELFWSEATLQALYDAIREYLEIDQRVENLNERLAVANDLLEIIHEHIANEAMSKITWIIIILIIVACIVACGEISARLVLHSRTSSLRTARAALTCLDPTMLLATSSKGPQLLLD